MPSLSAARALNAQFAPKTRPVIVVFGGTSGIGAGIVKAFAHNVPPSTGAHIIIIGRSKAAADALIASLPAHATIEYQFLRLDALLVRDLRAFIRDQLFGALALTKINYLVLSQGMVDLSNTRTAEGFQPMLALMFYGRVRTVLDLAPLLQAAAAQGEDARVLTIHKAGHGGPIDLDDVAINKISPAAAHPRRVTYTDIYTLELAARFPDISFTHADPGFVRSGVMRGLPFYLRWVYELISLLFATSPDACGEWLMCALLDPAARTGAWFKTKRGDPTQPNQWAVDETARKVVWQHVEERSDL